LGERPDAALARLDAALARQLERIRFDVPALRARRFEIPALAQCLLVRLAGEEGVPAPALDDGALALLWRQDWDGNLGELESTLHRALLFAPNPVLGAADFERLAARSGRKLVRRLPSRHPLRSDLGAALRTTLLGTGRVNKTRAATYLGWDPDTLVARLADLRIDPSVSFPDSAWDAPQPFAARAETSAEAEPELPPASA
jgi:DNA-binding NtrC family response regulator